MFNGAPSGTGSFKQSTGATYPILLDAALNSGGNFVTLYGNRDHLVVINRQGIVRYQANDRWQYGDPWLLNDVRACVDSLVLAVAGAHPGRLQARRPAQTPRSEPLSSAGMKGTSDRGATLHVAPDRSTVGVTLDSPFGHAVAARVTVHDLAGRHVATLLDGSVAPGPTRLTWDGRGPGGRAVASGIYHVLADLGGTRLSRRVALVR